MFTSLFWRDAGERAAATAAQALVGVFAASAVGLFDADFKGAASVAGMAALLSVLKSVAATQRGDGESASLLSTVVAKDVADYDEFDDEAQEAADRALADDDDYAVSRQTAPGTPLPPARGVEGDF